MTNLITILLVDDEKSIRDGLKLLLPWEEYGFHIMGEAENGLDALEKIKEQQPDIVITDLIMPELDGLKLSNIIQRQYPEIHFLVLSSFDDFPYVSQSFKNGAVDYLLKPTLTKESLLTSLTQLSHQITKTEKKLSEQDLLSQQLNRLLAGYSDTNYDGLTTYFKEDNHYILYTNLLWYHTKEQVIQTLESSLFNNMLPYLIEKNEYGIIFSSSLPYSEIKLKVAEKLHSLRMVEPTTFFVLSSPIREINELKEKLHQLKSEAKEQRFYFKQHTFITEEDFLSLTSTEQFDTKKYLRSLLDNDYQLGLTRIEDYFNDVIIDLPKPTVLRQQASSIFYTLFSTLIDAYDKKDDLQQLKQEFLFTVGQLIYLEDFSIFILSMIERINIAINTKEVGITHENELLHNITRYIEHHYASDLSLAMLAETFHFSYSYLSSFFSHHFNTNFSDYLNTVRLKAAKELLLTSDLNLSEIANQCGYSDLSYFSRQFKKYYGSSPSKYRRENQL
ncbi:helix-turn-helix domain-containing protein [Vagococcus sp. DIV0080]|uniref:Helix-turn-helix domain-containing protein n=1 Tax=Candidatus Vagococcus giribetii TaxID=2230876 RepID=A0ABS3HVR9_9ENTE|nr:helix-turn-helix domain-containing protein [Vagococcus sp. DIV0080]MBO0477853.1 helix-turn-helix domain-containing protein [Vagococcus sp. DIV0080]